MSSILGKISDRESKVEVEGQHGSPMQHVQLGYSSQLRRSRSLITALGMSLAIAAVPYGIGSSLTSAIYGGGQLSIFVGLLVVLILDGCVALSLAELSSRYPTSSGPYYWSYRLLEGNSAQKALSYTAGWSWLIGHWTIALSVNFGFASLVVATVSIYLPSWTASSWQLLLIFYAICMVTFTICAVGDKILPYVDAVAALWNLLTIITILLCLSTTATAGRHSAGYALGHYDSTYSGWGNGFTFFIGLLPPAYAFCAIGMITSVSEECFDPEVEVPRAISLCIPFGGLAAILFVLPICFTLPPLEDVLQAPYGQALPFIITKVMDSQPGALVVMLMVLIVVLFCSLSVTTAASRCTWEFARDNGVPLGSLWSSTVADRPLPALILVTVIEMLLGIINLGSTSAFTAFISVGVIALSFGYLVPISTSVVTGRRQVSCARWKLPAVFGTVVNCVAVCWIAFQLVLFSMPQVLPVTPASANYAAVVFAGFATFSLLWYWVVGRHGEWVARHIPTLTCSDRLLSVSWAARGNLWWRKLKTHMTGKVRVSENSQVTSSCCACGGVLELEWLRSF